MKPIGKLARIACVMVALTTTAALRESHALSWIQLSPAGTAPNPEVFPSVVYDPVGQRMVGTRYMGGSDLHILALAGAPTWTSPTTLNSPAGRNGCGTIYDPVRGRMVIIDGQISSLYLDEVWALSLGATLAWTQLATSGTSPGVRMTPTAIYDAPRDRVILYGGFDASYNSYNDVWALTLSGTPTWTQLTPAGGPSFGRSYHTAIYDPMRERMIVYAGNRGSALSYDILSDVWALSLSGTPTWTQLAPGGSPPAPREGHAAVYDPVRDRMLVFGGDNGNAAVDETWELTLGGSPQWNQLAPTGTLPPGRFATGLIYDSDRDQLVLWEGTSYSALLNDVWTLPLAGSVDVVGPSAIETAIQFAAPRPNPTRDAASLTFTLRRAAHARLEVYDLAGRRVRTLLDDAVGIGSKTVSWDRRDRQGVRAPAGLYFIELAVEAARLEQRLVVLE